MLNDENVLMMKRGSHPEALSIISALANFTTSPTPWKNISDGVLFSNNGFFPVCDFAKRDSTTDVFLWCLNMRTCGAWFKLLKFWYCVKLPLYVKSFPSNVETCKNEKQNFYRWRLLFPLIYIVNTWRWDKINSVKIIGTSGLIYLI